MTQITAEKTMAILYTLADKFLEGKDIGTEQMAKLTGRLLDENRLEDLRQITEDKEYRDKLLKEYEIS